MDRLVLGYSWSSNFQGRRKQCRHPCTIFNRDRPSLEFAPASVMPISPTEVSASLDLDDVPFPVAYPMSFAGEPSLSAAERLDNLVFAAYQAMRTAGLIMLADYLDVEASDAKVQDAVRGLRQPHWGEWATLNQKLCRFWDDPRAEHQTRFPAIVRGWRVVGDGKAQGEWSNLLKGIPGTQGPARNANDALQKLRNDRAHRMATRTPEQSEQATLERVLPIVSALCATLFPPGAVALYRRASADGAPLTAFLVHGAHQDLTFTREVLDPAWSGLFQDTGVAAIADGQGVSVYPLFAPGDDEPGRLAEVVTLVDGIGKKSVVLLGVRSFTESARLYGPLMAAFARKSVDFGLAREKTYIWSIVDWSRATAREEVADLRGRKYFPECYVERPSVDGSAAHWIARGGSALLLLGEAGSGKSSLIARLVEHLTADPISDSGRETPRGQGRVPGQPLGDVVLYLTGRHAYAGDLSLPGPQLLADAVFRRAGIKSGSFRDLDDLFRHLASSMATDWAADRRLWLVFDGMNEADRFVDVLSAVDAILPAAARYPWLRLVLSMRRGAYASLERRHGDLARHGRVFGNEHHLARFFDDVEGGDRPYLDVRPFDPALEGSLAYRRRADAFPEKACPVPYETLPVDVRTLLLNPLHLHVFHETHAGQSDVTPDLDASTLIGGYLDRICADLTSMRGVLLAVGEYMVAHDTPGLPVDVSDRWLSDWRAEQGFDSAARVVKLDPIEELVSGSILMRPAREGFGVDRSLVAFTFSHQRICEQVIVRELRRSIAPRSHLDSEDLARFAEHAASHPDFVEYLGALRIIVAHAARRGEAKLLGGLLAMPQAEIRRELIEGAVKALGLAWGPSEVGRPGPSASLEELAARALETEASRDAWLEGSDVAQWLARRGASHAALAIARSRVAALNEIDESAPEKQARSVEEFLELADAFDRFGRSAEVRSNTERAIAIARRLPQTPPESIHAGLLAAALRDLGSLDRSEGQLRRARALLEEALAVSRTLVAAAPDDPGAAANLASVCEELGRLEAEARRPEAARRLFEEALASYRHLAMAAPGDRGLWRRVASACSRVANAALDDDISLARTLYEEALALRRSVAAAQPDRVDLARRVASAQKDLGRLEIAAGRPDAARVHFEAALVVNRRLVTLEPDHVDFADSLSTALDRMGSLEARAKRVDLARGYYEEALEIDRRLALLLKNDARRARAVSISCDRLGQIAVEAGDLDRAQAYFEEALAVDRRLVAVNPEAVKNASYLGASLNRLAELARQRGQLGLAEAYSEDALAVAAQLLDPAEPESLNDYAWDALLVARARLVRGDPSGALALAGTALERARSAAATAAHPHIRDTVASLLQLRAECLCLCAPEEVWASLEETLLIRRELVLEDPSDGDYVPALIGTLRFAATIATDDRRDSLLEEAAAIEVDLNMPGRR